jgi:hypothetical protein
MTTWLKEFRSKSSLSSPSLLSPHGMTLQPQIYERRADFIHFLLLITNPITDYLPPVKLGAVMRASAVGKIVASKCPNRKVGQSVSLQWFFHFIQ